MKLETYFHTVRYLKPVQVYSRALRHVPHRGMPPGAVISERPVRGPWRPAIAHGSGRAGESRYRLLNSERTVQDWQAPGAPRLWLYHLHYIDSPSLPLMRSWIRANEHATGIGWEPYPTARRIVNWIKHLLDPPGDRTPACVLSSLAAQAHHLERCLEYHLLGNHLLADAKALAFAGAFLESALSDQWFRRGIRILDDQLTEQILADGAHFELSPMYHSIVLEDLLDLVNLAGAYPQLVPAATLNKWRHAAARMAGWLAEVCHPDGQIPFFNDAAFGMAPPPSALFAYAGRLGVSPAAARSTSLIRLEAGPTTCIFDVAPIGPDYQPGHAHADTLSFELSHAGRRILVNSGTSTYECCFERTAERGTAAHNTVRIDGLDQSEIWAAFRVARRARTFAVSRAESGGVVRAAASHDGYRRLPDPVVHRRLLEVSQGALTITDAIEGKSPHSAEFFFHVHPAFRVSQSGHVFHIRDSGTETAALHLDPALHGVVTATLFHPEFGLSEPMHTIVGATEALLPASFETRIVLNN